MKKLMIAMAAMTAGVAMADVTSANIVGYANNSLSNGYKAVSIPFKAVGTVVDGKRGIYLSQIVVSGADKITTSENTVQLQALDPEGRAGITYTYHKGEGPSSRYYKVDGWYQGTKLVGTGVDDQFYPEGTGLWVSGKATLDFLSSGEVELDTIQTDLVSGYRLIGNPYPTTIKLSNFVPTGVEKITTSENTVQIQSLDTEGRAGITYTYHKGEGPSSRYYKVDGWYQGTKLVGSGVPDVDIPAGVSLWVSSANPEIDIQVVTPFEDAE